MDEEPEEADCLRDHLTDLVAWINLVLICLVRQYKLLCFCCMFGRVN